MDKKVLLLMGETPQTGVSLPEGGTVNIFYGCNRIPSHQWEKVESNQTAMAGLKSLEDKGDLLFIEFSKTENHDDISTIKDAEKAKLMARFEFCPSRLRRWSALEKRAEIRELIDNNLAFISQHNLENEDRGSIVRKFQRTFTKFETLRKNKKQKNLVKQEW